MGDSSAAIVRDAFQAHAGSLYRYIYDRVRDGPLAEDLTSEVFLKALRWVRQERSPESVRGWLYATARTTVADYWRGRGQQALVPLTAAEDMPAHADSDTWGRTDARDRLLPLLWRLSAREREVLTLRYLHSYSTAEIGQTLGVSAEYVRQLHLRALRHAARYERHRRTRLMNAPLETLTDEARQALARAEEEAIGFKHNQVGTEFILLALLQGNTTAARVLSRLGVEDYRIRGGITFILGQGIEAPTEAKLVPRVMTVLEYAAEEAQRLGRPRVGPEHILLGLVREGQGIAAGMLEMMNVPLDHVREETLKSIAAA